jgi:hypothetical protein
MPDNTSIVASTSNKKLTVLQRRILEEDLKGTHKTNTSIANAIGSNAGYVGTVRNLPQYLVAYDSYRDRELSKTLNIGKHTHSELQTAMIKLKTLVEESPNLQTYGSYVKLLIEAAKGTSELDLDSQATEELDTDAIRNDLTTLMGIAVLGRWSIPALVDYYMENGTPPTSDIVPRKEASPAPAEASVTEAR